MMVSVAIRAAAAAVRIHAFFSMQMRHPVVKRYVLDSYTDDCDTQIDWEVRVAPDWNRSVLRFDGDMTLSSAVRTIEYHHQYPNAKLRPVKAEIAADGLHISWLSMPCMTAATDSRAE